MEDSKEILDKQLEERKIPLVNPVFIRKVEVRETLKKMREESRMGDRNKRVKRKFRMIYWAAAAVFILLSGVGAFYLSEKKLSTTDTTLEHNLPDGSYVQIMENSILSFNRFGWIWKRRLKLAGTAFFNVVPGKTFTVHTQAGDVTVLGTKFWVYQQDDEIIVSCKEGYVKLETPIGVIGLAAGERVCCNANEIGLVEKETKLRKILGYENDPLVNVIADIEQIFQIKVTGREKCEGLFYNGIIYTRDLEETLKRVFGTFRISYHFNGKEVVLL